VDMPLAKTLCTTTSRNRLHISTAGKNLGDIQSYRWWFLSFIPAFIHVSLIKMLMFILSTVYDINATPKK
jgi:hypothetical protein